MSIGVACRTFSKSCFSSAICESPNSGFRVGREFETSLKSSVLISVVRSALRCAHTEGLQYRVAYSFAFAVRDHNDVIGLKHKVLFFILHYFADINLYFLTPARGQVCAKYDAITHSSIEGSALRKRHRMREGSALAERELGGRVRFAGHIKDIRRRNVHGIARLKARITRERAAHHSA